MGALVFWSNFVAVSCWFWLFHRSGEAGCRAGTGNPAYCANFHAPQFEIWGCFAAGLGLSGLAFSLLVKGKRRWALLVVCGIAVVQVGAIAAAYNSFQPPSR